MIPLLPLANGQAKPMSGPMPSFDIKVPFPYTDRPIRQHRPALVVAADGLEVRHGLL
jgi:mRNA interferase MazF